MTALTRSLLTGAALFMSFAASNGIAAPDPGASMRVDLIAGATPGERLQAIIVSRALTALGYTVEMKAATSAPDAHMAVRDHGHVFTAHWDPLHDSAFEAAGGDGKLERRGALVPDSIQGYLIDTRTARKHGIKSWEDLHDPKIARLFDTDGDGKANVAGCPPDTACGRIIDHHIVACGLQALVEQDRGGDEATRAAMQRVEDGKPAIYYARAQHWSGAAMRREGRVKWLMVPAELHFLPAKKTLFEDGVQTSRIDGGNFGFRVSQQRILTQRAWAKAHPGATRLFEMMTIDPDDIAQHNLRLYRGEVTEAGIAAEADAWIAAHRTLFDGWLQQARAAGANTGR